MFTILQAAQPDANMPFLFAAFAVTWVIFFAYAFFISRRRQETQREVRDLKQVLEGEDPGDSAS